MSLIIRLYSLESTCLEFHENTKLFTHLLRKTIERYPRSKRMGKNRYSSYITNEPCCIEYVACLKWHITPNKPFVKNILKIITISSFLQEIFCNIRSGNWSLGFQCKNLLNWHSRQLTLTHNKSIQSFDNLYCSIPSCIFLSREEVCKFCIF